MVAPDGQVLRRLRDCASYNKAKSAKSTIPEAIPQARPLKPLPKRVAPQTPNPRPLKRARPPELDYTNSQKSRRGYLGLTLSGDDDHVTYDQPEPHLHAGFYGEERSSSPEQRSSPLPPSSPPQSTPVPHARSKQHMASLVAQHPRPVVWQAPPQHVAYVAAQHPRPVVQQVPPQHSLDGQQLRKHNLIPEVRRYPQTPRHVRFRPERSRLRQVSSPPIAGPSSHGTRFRQVSPPQAGRSYNYNAGVVRCFMSINFMMLTLHLQHGWDGSPYIGGKDTRM